MRKPLLTIASLLVFASTLGAASVRTRSPFHGSGPARHTVRVPSPDGRWLLVISPFQLNAESTLTLIDRGNGQSTVIQKVDRDIDVDWSPDSRAFALNDAYGSNVASAYVHRPGEAAPLNLNDVILKAGVPAYAASADHAYFQAVRWISPRTLLAEYCGHNSTLPDHHFDFLYRITLAEDRQQATGIRLVSSRTGPALIAQPECRY